MRDALTIFLSALHDGKNACVRMDGCAAPWRSFKRNSSRAAFCSDGSAKFPVLPKEFDLEKQGLVRVRNADFFLLRQGKWLRNSIRRYYNIGVT